MPEKAFKFTNFQEVKVLLHPYFYMAAWLAIKKKLS